MKFLAGTVLGLSVGLLTGGLFFNHQVPKVDTFSFKIGYIQGRVDEARDPAGNPTETEYIACQVYFEQRLDRKPPFGYTVADTDRKLKEMCGNATIENLRVE